MKNQIDFQKCIPVSADKNINYETRLISRNVYLFRLIKISIMKNQIDFQKFIPVSADKNMNYEETRLISRN